MTRTSLLLGAVIALLAAAPAAAAPVEVTIPFDRDVVAGTNDLVADENEGADGGTMAYVTQAAAAASSSCSGNPDGLPGDGFFPANASHPDIQLAPFDTDAGNNIHRLTDYGETIGSPTVDAPAGHYTELHVIAASGSGNSSLYVGFNYAEGGDQSAVLDVPDWLQGPPPGGYALIDNLDRIDRTTLACQDASDYAVFGLRYDVNPAKTLSSLYVAKDTSDVGADLNIFGLFLVPVHDVTVTRTGAGAGTVTGAPFGIDCGADCTERVRDGNAYQLTATPADGSTFAGWSGACSGTGTCDLTVDGPKDVTAQFEPVPAGPGPGPGPGPGTGPGSGPGTGPGTGPTPLTPETVPFTQLADPAVAQPTCVRRRRLKVKVRRRVRGSDVTAVTVTVRRKARQLTARQLRNGITLRKLPRKKQFKVRIAVTTADGKRYVTTRSYTPCPRRRTAS